MDPTNEEAHEALSAVAKQQGATASRLVGSVSRHVLPETASFANLAALQASARGCQRASTYIATSSNELVFSCKLTAPTTTDAAVARRKRKRSDGEASSGL